MEITVSRSMSHMLWSRLAQTGASSCGFVGYVMKLDDSCGLFVCLIVKIVSMLVKGGIDGKTR